MNQHEDQKSSQFIGQVEKSAISNDGDAFNFNAERDLYISLYTPFLDDRLYRLLQRQHNGADKISDSKSLPTSLDCPGGLPLIWNVPYSRNPFFTGREELLSLLHNQFLDGQSTALSQPQVISGLGGVGKTQLALEYAYRYLQKYQVVFWVQAERRDTLTLSYRKLAILLNLLEKDKQESSHVSMIVKHWLQHNQNWLLILDNVDELMQVRDFLPPTLGGHVLITTQALTTRRFARQVRVDMLLPEQGARFLLRRANLLATDASLEQATAQERDQAQAIYEDLGGLPLALDQAGAYIEAGCSLKEYQSLYRLQRREMLKERGFPRDNDHPESVLTTFKLSFKKVARISPAAIDLLHFLAFLQPDNISEEIVTEGATDLGPILQPVAHDPKKLQDTFNVLYNYALIRRNHEMKTLSLHHFIQAVVRDSMEEKVQRRWVVRVVRVVSQGLQDPQSTQWQRYSQYIPHAYVCRELIAQWEMVSPEAESLLLQSGAYLQDTLKYGEAEPFYLQLLTLHGQRPKPEPLEVAFALNNLGLLRMDQGKYEEAKPLLEHALAIIKQISGPEHPNTATILNNLAGLYKSQGKYEQAEPLHVRALAICEKQLGAEHPNTATILNNLATLYENQEKYEQAEPLHMRARAIHEQQLGAEHPNTATSLNNLAELYENQGKYEQAEPLHVRALAICEKQLGAEHPNTATSLNNLAELYENQGKYAEAEPLLVRALAIREQQLGAEHPNTATSLNNLAALYKSQGRYVEAEPLYVRALAICKQQLGAEHPNTATSLNNLAGLYKSQGKYEQAETLYMQALTIREQALGTFHPDTAQSLWRLAVLSERQHYSQEAKGYYQRALGIYERTLGAEHSTTQRVQRDYITLLKIMKQNEETS